MLPSPARTLWDRAAHVLDRALTQFRNPQPAWHLGGGTLLAARWNHRSSTDIDLTVPAGAGIETLYPDYRCTFGADMKAPSGRSVASSLRTLTETSLPSAGFQAILEA